MQLVNIALSQLSISPANMRQGKKPPDISDILPSVRARGVLVPVLVRPNGSAESFEIVAGRRRFHAALRVASETDTQTPLPCAILDDGDDAAALEASLIENMIRQDPDEVTKWESFTRLVKQGRCADDLAATFGMSGQMVKCILALGNLLPRIREAYRSGQIDVTSIRHLTLATTAQQKTWLAMRDDPQGYAPTGSHLKAWLFGGESISTSVALFDLEGYDGRIVTDLFEADGWFGDVDAFWAAQSAAIEKRKAAYCAEGWSDVRIVPPGTYFNLWEHQKTAKRKCASVYIDVKATGEVVFHEGYITNSEAKRRANAIAKGGSESEANRVFLAEITGTMTEYINLHRHAAVRAVLATKPQVALRVMVAHAICGSRLWRVEVQDQRSRNQAVTESIETSASESQFDERRCAVLAVLGFDPEALSVTSDRMSHHNVEQVFARLLELPDPVVMEVLAVAMAETLAAGSDLIEPLGVHLHVDMANVWQADAAFYDLIRDREVLTHILTEVGGVTVAQAHAGEKAKTIKSVINDFLTGEKDRPKVDAWVPRWMAFPPSAYTQRGGVATVSNADRAAWLAELETERAAERATANSAQAAEADANAVALTVALETEDVDTMVEANDDAADTAAAVDDQHDHDQRLAA